MAGITPSDFEDAITSAHGTATRRADPIELIIDGNTVEAVTNDSWLQEFSRELVTEVWRKAIAGLRTYPHDATVVLEVGQTMDEAITLSDWYEENHPLQPRY